MPATTDRGEAPAWIHAFMHEIDTLEFATAFATNLDQDTEMIFGTARVHGVDAIKDFFVKIDAPLITTHEVIETWTVGDVLILRGEATVAKKTEPDTVVRAPFTHIFYLDQSDEALPRIRTLHITAGPVETDALL
ncbi:nuclear transport factor 2 family protein [Kitasatospora sp. NBC_01250]|uniref:nuclear transport factor 2 family protein n=1 Tax=unclassified Kitasatospora TaxID=2633591 RepID=UPI002E113E88|nr:MULTISPECIES: nuclear transport factor 2 family protein [unclassified Kitasatospora]WSJ71688.1 nuclear transport factor 2 family protein [Kitasatospora sp. NBC_01302]